MVFFIGPVMSKISFPFCFIVVVKFPVDFIKKYTVLCAKIEVENTPKRKNKKVM